jgi:hypothetical protein
VRTRLDAQLKVLAAVWREAGGRASEHVAKFRCEGCELRGVTTIGRQREGWTLDGEGNAADEELRAIGERSTGISKASEVSAAQAASTAVVSVAAMAERRVAGAQCEGRPRVGTGPRPAEPRHAAPLCTEAGLVSVVEEGEVVCAQPVVAEDDVGVAFHVEIHEGGFLIKAVENQ